MKPETKRRIRETWEKDSMLFKFYLWLKMKLKEKEKKKKKNDNTK